jgi:type I restriction enzyme S subunit
VKEGWKIKKLCDLFDVKSCKRVHKADWQTEGIPFYRAREIVKLAQFGHVNNDLFITPELFEKFTKEKGYPQEGDIVISAVGTLGKCYLIKKNDKFYFKDASVLWFEKTSDVDTSYIDYSFKSNFVLDQVMDNSMGATVGTLTITRAKKIQIPLPPLPEQKRIVDILDKAFAGINQAVAHAEKNLANGRALFESYLNTIFTQKGEGWEEKKLADIYDVRDGTHDSPKYQKNGFPLITSKNLKRDGLNFDKVKLISKEDYTKINKRSGVHKGDILFAMIGTIGNPIVVEIEPDFAIKNVALFKPLKDQNSYFLKYYLQAEVSVSKMGKEAKGTTQKFVGLGYLRDFPISVPVLKIQLAIVAKLNALANNTNHLETIYQQKLNTLTELKQSILQKAFSGELTADTIQ